MNEQCFSLHYLCGLQKESPPIDQIACWGVKNTEEGKRFVITSKRGCVKSLATRTNVHREQRAAAEVALQVTSSEATQDAKHPYGLLLAGRGDASKPPSSLVSGHPTQQTDHHRHNCPRCERFTLCIKQRRGKRARNTTDMRSVEDE